VALPSFLRYTQSLFTTMPLDQIPIKRFRLGEMQSYEVLVSDFNRIQSEAMSIGTDFAFAVALIPVAVTFTTTLAVATISLAWVRESFTLLMYVCYILGLYFAVRAFRQRGRLKTFMQTIRDAQVPPLGEKGGEIGPSELESLPSGEQSGTEGKK
jgi:hypothetical protein